ncbi:hypothetical protein VTK26DRAFT_1277 [Humicola hyalothermophila]
MAMLKIASEMAGYGGDEEQSGPRGRAPSLFLLHAILYHQGRATGTELPLCACSMIAHQSPNEPEGVAEAAIQQAITCLWHRPRARIDAGIAALNKSNTRRGARIALRPKAAISFHTRS